MEETMTNAPICKTQICKRPLTYLEDTKCWRCLNCNPIRKTNPQLIQPKAFLDVKMTEKRVAEMVREALETGTITYVVVGKTHPETIKVEISHEQFREIVRDELENWHIQKPSVMKDEIAETVTMGSSANNEETVITEETWLQKAKRLSVPTHYESGGMRKKVDVLKDIEAKERQGTDEEL